MASASSRQPIVFYETVRADTTILMSLFSQLALEQINLERIELMQHLKIADCYALRLHLSAYPSFSLYAWFNIPEPVSTALQ